MKKRIVIIVSLVLIVCIFCSMSILMEYAQQKGNIIRLHVVGASDSEEDQSLKLMVRDAVLASLSADLALCETVEDAKKCIGNKLRFVEQAATDVLWENGVDAEVSISFEKEAFPTRYYDKFALPSGVYQTLRIEIGKAEGRNWWCVVFPSFCYSIAGDSFEDVAAASGFSQPLRDTLAGENEYKICFFVLDFFGRLENFFHFR